MLISHSYRFIFLKTHKTASTSTEIYFEQFLFPDLYESHSRPLTIREDAIVGTRMLGVNPENYFSHMIATKIRSKLGEKIFDDYTKITNIRNPFDAMVSRYHYENIDIPFKDWILKTNCVKNCLKQFQDAMFIDNELIIDEFIRYESLLEDIEMIRKKLKLPEPTRNLNHYKKSKERKHYFEYYDSETRDMVESIFKEFLDKFNYRFS